MEYSIGVAILGVAIGAVFRSKLLLPIIGVLLAISIIGSIYGSLNLLDTALLIIVPQAAVQGGYFLGLLLRHVIIPTCTRLVLWISLVLNHRRIREGHGTDPGPALPQKTPKPNDIS